MGHPENAVAGGGDAGPLQYASPAATEAVAPVVWARLVTGVGFIGFAMVFGWLAVETSDEWRNDLILVRAFQPFPGAYAGLCALLNAAGLTWLLRSKSRTAGGRHPVRWGVVMGGLAGFYGGIALYYASSVRYAFVHLELLVSMFARFVSFVGFCLFCTGLTPRRIRPRLEPTSPSSS